MILNSFVATLERKKNSNMRAGIRIMADGVVFTKTQKRIMNKLTAAYFYNLKTFFMNWKMFAFSKMRNYYAKLKARVIDRFVILGMSDTRKLYQRWMKYVMNSRLVEHGDRVKAGYILKAYVNRFRGWRDQMLMKYGFDKLQ